MAALSAPEAEISRALQVRLARLTPRILEVVPLERDRFCSSHPYHPWPRLSDRFSETEPHGDPGRCINTFVLGGTTRPARRPTTSNAPRRRPVAG